MKLNTPVNSSLSVAISQRDMRTVTSAAASPLFAKDRLWLNGEEQNVAGNKRVLRVLQEIRNRARATQNKEDVPNPDSFIHIASYNNFPTAAGLASSAAGYACMVAALGTWLKFSLRFALIVLCSTAVQARQPRFLF